MIEIQDLTKTYEGFKAVDGLSLRVEKRLPRLCYRVSPLTRQSWTMEFKMTGSK